jgi:hypothetical protein
VFKTSCPRCGVEFDYDIANCEINIYKQDDCNHLVIFCPGRKHYFRLFSTLPWLKAAQQQIKNRLNVKFQGNAPAELRDAAKQAWNEQSLIDELDKTLTRYGETGLLY